MRLVSTPLLGWTRDGRKTNAPGRKEFHGEDALLSDRPLRQDKSVRVDAELWIPQSPLAQEEESQLSQRVEVY